MLHFLLPKTGRHARNIKINKHQQSKKEKSSPKEPQCHDGVSRRLVLSMFMHPGRFFRLVVFVGILIDDACSGFFFISYTYHNPSCTVPK